MKDLMSGINFPWMKKIYGSFRISSHLVLPDRYMTGLQKECRNLPKSLNSFSFLLLKYVNSMLITSASKYQHLPVTIIDLHNVVNNSKKTAAF